ncbi:MAG: GNAT family N-acetyltransferase [Treponema sp.]|nr:GNAT family N-acetyltransferase [Treponema sp.]
MATAYWVAIKEKKMNFYKETITKENIKDYKSLIDSIRYICSFNGYDLNFEYDDDVKNPSLPENGVLENNHFVGFRLTATKEPCVYIQYYAKFMSADTVFLGDFFEDKKFHGKGYGKEIYNLLENEWKKSGFTRIVLNVDLKNSAAILFWIKMGFKNIDFSFQSNENETEKFYMLRLSKNI